MFEVWFLVAIGVIWIIFSVIQDLKTREVANWVSLSLIVFVLGFRFFWSLFNGLNYGEVFSFFYQGLIGLGVFFIIGNLFYYGKIFAGGDAKLMIALGTVLPFYSDFFKNVEVMGLYVILFLVSGAVYGLISSFYFAFNNRKRFNKEFKKQFRKNKKRFYFIFALGVFIAVFSFFDWMFMVLGAIVFVSPYFYLWAKSVDEACMVKKVSPSRLTEGDWLYENLRIKGKTIKARWEGLSKEEIKLIRKNKKDVYIRYGIPFTPVFLISFLALVYILFF